MSNPEFCLSLESQQLFLSKHKLTPVTLFKKTLKALFSDVFVL